MATWPLDNGQVPAEVSGQWHWGCQSGSGLASTFFGAAYSF